MNQEDDHKHGGNPGDDIARLGLGKRPVTDFSVNLNPLGIPDVVLDKWNELIHGIRNYPSIDGRGIFHFYSRKMGIPPENFLAGNGSTELIYLIPRVLGFRNVLVITPSYHDYERAFVISGASVKRICLLPGRDFQFPDLSEVSGELRGADALWIGRPNNPTGTLCSRNTVLELASKHPEKYLIVDEAFIQFVDNWQKESLVSEAGKDNILIIHSLTKFYALAGLRMGGVIGSERVIARLKKAKEPWTVNGIADMAARLLEDCSYYEEKTHSYIRNERKRVNERLLKTDGIVPFPSTTNFILCKWIKTDNLDDLIIHLLRNGMYVRDCRNFPGLEDNFFRFGLRSVEENDRLIRLLECFPGEQV